MTHFWRTLPDPLGYFVELSMWISVVTGLLRILLFVLQHA